MGILNFKMEEVGGKMWRERERWVNLMYHSRETVYMYQKNTKYNFDLF